MCNGQFGNRRTARTHFYKGGDRMASNQCENCLYYSYDDEFDEWVCDVADCMDEDEVFRMTGSRDKGCTYYRPGDDYTIVRRQN